MTWRPKVGLVVDHPQRDLPGLVLVARRLCDFGCDAYLIPLNLLAAEVFSLVPDFVLFNYLRRNIEPVLRGCLSAGISFGVLDTEGGLYGDLGLYGKTLTDDPEVRGGVKTVCVWGRKMRAFLLDSGIFGEHQMVLTGAPRFDFYALRWRSFYQGDELTGDSTKPLVLINTKVAVSNPQHHTVEQEIELYVQGLGLPREEVLRFREVGLETIKATLDLSNRLARDFPDNRFVLRPHPHERLSTYEQGIEAGIANLAVVREGTIDRWIAHASALIHRQCTTAVEATMAGVPAIAPQWVPTSGDAPDTEAISLRCETYDDMQELLNAINRGEPVITTEIERELSRIIDEWFFAADGLGYERVAEAVRDVLPERQGVDDSIAARYFHRTYEPAFSLRGAVGRTVRWGRLIAPTDLWGRLLYPHAARWARTPKGFTAEEVAFLLDRMHASLLQQDRAEGRCVALPATTAEAYKQPYRGHSVLVRPAS